MIANLKPYPVYKDSGIEWLGQIPAHWDLQRLGSTVASSQNGVWGDEAQGDENDIACIRVADFDRQGLVVREPEDGFTIRNVSTAQYAGRVLKQDDLLLEKSGGGEKQLVGAVVRYQLKGPAVCSNFVSRVVLEESHDAVFLTYLHFALYAARVNFRSIKQSTGIQNLDEKQYFSEVIALPCQEEQQAIADFLDREVAKIDALVEKKEQLIELLQEKRTALITHAVTKGLDSNVPMKDSGNEWPGEIPEHWKGCFLGRAFSVQGGYAFHSDDFVTEGIPVIRMTNLKSGTLDLGEAVCVEKSTALDEFALKPDDLVVGMSGSLSNYAWVKKSDTPCQLNQRVGRVKSRTDRAKVRYAMYVLSSRPSSAQINVMSVGTAQQNISAWQIEHIYFAFPPLSEQQAIADFLDCETAKIDALITKVQEAIKRLKEYGTALISAAVTGKIDVRRPVKYEGMGSEGHASGLSMSV